MAINNIYPDGIASGWKVSDAGALTAAQTLEADVAIIDADTGALAEPPDFLTRGLVNSDTMFAEVVPHIDKALAKAAADGIGGADATDPARMKPKIESVLKGLALPVLRLYWKGPLVKVEIGVGRGKTKGDQRQDIKEMYVGISINFSDRNTNHTNKGT